MTTRDPSPPLSTPAVEPSALTNTPHAPWSPTRITAPQFPFPQFPFPQFPFPLIARPGRDKDARTTAPDVPAFDRWPVVAADPQHEWATLPTRPGGTPVRLPVRMPARLTDCRLVEVRGGRS
jgi:hypothetical protein